MRKAKAAAPLKKISRGEIYVFKVKNRRSYAAICKDNLCEGTTPQQAMRRLYHPLRRMGYDLVLTVLLALSAAQPVTAGQIDKPVTQVKIESKILEATDSFSKDLGVDYLLFHKVEGRDTKAEVALVVTTKPGEKTTVEASILSFGGGADFRRVETQNPMLVVYPETTEGGSIKMQLRPEKTEITHITKSSVGSLAAPFLFAALGSQYEGAGAEAASNPGQVCPVTGKPMGGGEGGGRGDTAKAIDKAGMAAGMGLLASQAKGQLDGLKAQWTLDPMTRYKFDVKFDAYNKNSKKTENLTQTVTIGSPARTKGLVAEFAGVQYKAKDTAEHKDFTLITGIDVKREGDKTHIDVLSDLRPKGGTNDWELGKVNIGVGGDLTYKHHWDDFDETGHCYDCDFYEPFADEDNYDDYGYYIGPPLSVKLKVLETALEIVDNNQTLKSVFVSNVPFIRTLFTTEVKNKKTRELVVFVRPYILRPSDTAE